MTPPHIYLAGPDVFLPNALEIAREKRRLCSEHGFVGRSPVDNDLDLPPRSKADLALHISAANEEMIRQCDLVIANVTPFRGPSADVGTAYEMGFARALGRPVFAYSNVEGSLLERTLQHELESTRMTAPPGHPTANEGSTDLFGMSIENFGLFDNLMLVGAVRSSGAEIVIHPVAIAARFTDLGGFVMCLAQAAKRFGLPSTSGTPN